jgi:release factor glutamine methyltransferase
MTTSLRDLVNSARARLVSAGVDGREAAMDASLLARHALGWELAGFLAHQDDTPPPSFAGAYEALVRRRAAREPVSAILGRREFWGLEFAVTPDVLAPRPETEIILEAAVDACGSTGATPILRGPGAVIVDVGTGSGCLAVGLAREFPGARVVATDISLAALAVAARNAARHGVDGRVQFVRTSLLSGVAGPAALIVSNPPYIPTDDIPSLPPEVSGWEPRPALDGGADGLDAIRALLDDSARVLAPGGWLIMEFGFGQADAVRAAVLRSPLELVEIRCDLQGIPRTLVARRASGQPGVPRLSLQP